MDWKYFLPNITSEIPGVPVSVAISKLKEAVREFCRKSWVWRVKEEVVTDEQFTPVEVDDADIIAISAIKGYSDKSFGYNPTYKELELNSSPDKELTLEVTFVIMPKANAPECPDWLAENHKDGIEAYAKFLLASMRSREWFFPDQAYAFRNEFHRLVAGARIDKAKQGTGRSLQVKARRFV